MATIQLLINRAAKYTGLNDIIINIKDGKLEVKSESAPTICRAVFNKAGVGKGYVGEVYGRLSQLGWASLEYQDMVLELLS